MFFSKIKLLLLNEWLKLNFNLPDFFIKTICSTFVEKLTLCKIYYAKL